MRCIRKDRRPTRRDGCASQSRTASVSISSAKLAGGKKIQMPKAGILGPVAFPDRGPLRLEVVLTEPQRLALEVEAHEA